MQNEKILQAEEGDNEHLNASESTLNNEHRIKILQFQVEILKNSMKGLVEGLRQKNILTQ
jgi:hypothetical protein